MMRMMVNILIKKIIIFKRLKQTRDIQRLKQFFVEEHKMDPINDEDDNGSNNDEDFLCQKYETKMICLKIKDRELINEKK